VLRPYQLGLVPEDRSAFQMIGALQLWLLSKFPILQAFEGSLMRLGVGDWTTVSPSAQHRLGKSVSHSSIPTLPERSIGTCLFGPTAAQEQVSHILFLDFSSHKAKAPDFLCGRLDVLYRLARSVAVYEGRFTTGGKSVEVYERGSTAKSYVIWRHPQPRLRTVICRLFF
jgi:hypothetical protein